MGRGAWRARQHASIALDDLNDFFCQRLMTTYTDSARDLEPPFNVEKVQRLLETTSMCFNPF